MIALGFWSYNYVRRHNTLKSTPAQTAGLADHQWTMEELVEAADAWHEANLNARFEKAFRERIAPKRTHPKSYAPTPKDQLPVPWYLNPNGTPPDMD